MEHHTHTHTVGIWKDISSAGPVFTLTQLTALTFTARLRDGDSLFICVACVCDQLLSCRYVCVCIFQKLVEQGAGLPWVPCCCTNLDLAF